MSSFFENLEALAIRRERFPEIALEVVRQSEVIPDVGLQRAGRDVLRVGLAVGFDLVRLAAGELRRIQKVTDGAIDLPGAQVPVTPMAIEPRVAAILGEPARVDRDGLGETPQVRGAPPHPDKRVGGWSVPVLLLCLLQLRASRCALRRPRSTQAAGANRPAATPPPPAPALQGHRAQGKHRAQCTVHDQQQHTPGCTHIINGFPLRSVLCACAGLPISCECGPARLRPQSPESPTSRDRS